MNLSRIGLIIGQLTGVTALNNLCFTDKISSHVVTDEKYILKPVKR